MCTVSWVLGEGGFDLLSNRDERRSRGVAVPPQEFGSQGARYLAPTDSDAGGTWIAVNEHGLCLTLLNDDPFPGPGSGPPPGLAGGDFISRGQLVRDLAHERGLPELIERLSGTLRELRSYRGFRLVALEPGSVPRQFRWDRAHLSESEVGPVDLPVASSAYGDRDQVRAARRVAWEKLVLDPGGPTAERLLTFTPHVIPNPGRAPSA